MKSFSPMVAFLGLVATLSLVRADSLGGMVSSLEGSIRNEASGAENAIRRNMPRIRLPSDRPHLPNMPNVNMPDIHMPNMPNVNMPDFHMPNMPNMPDIHMPNMPDIHMPNMPNFHMPNMPDFNMPDFHMPNMPDISMPNMPNMPSMPNMNIMSRLRSELQALESDLSNALPSMPSANGMINRVRGMIRSIMPRM